LTSSNLVPASWAGAMVGTRGGQENACLNTSLGLPRTWASGSNKSPPLDAKVLARHTAAAEAANKHDQADRGNFSARDPLSSRSHLGMTPIGSLCEPSVESRLGQLSKRTCSKLIPSSAELERAYIEKKQHDLRRQRVRNEKSCYSAIHCPEGVSSATARSRTLTVPQEFNLSVNRATTPSRSVCSADTVSDTSDCESEWSHSLRKRPQRVGSKEQRAWQPQLTVPEGPALRTAHRARSTSSRRSARGNPHRECSRSAAPSPSPSDGSSMSIGSAQSVRGRSHGRRAAHHMPGKTSPSRSVQSYRSASSSASDMSLVSFRSHLSRLSRLSQRHQSRDKRSSEELEQLKVEAKKKEVQNIMRHNERACRDAICNPPSLSFPRTSNLTVPQEFNLSCGSARERSCRHDTSVERRDWAGSLKGSSAQRSQSVNRDLQMKLTVPEEPNLLTAHRARSASSRGATRQRSMSKHRHPREQAAIEQHLGRVAAARSVQDKSGKSGADASARKHSRAETEQWVRQAADAEERAQRARLVAQAEHEAALAAQKEQLCIF